MSERPYSRLYHDLIERAPDVWDDHALRGDWAACLVEADQAWPTPFLPSRLILDASLSLFVERGLLLDAGHGRYRITGLDAEREGRSAKAKAAADRRWGADARSSASGSASSSAQSSAQSSATPSSPSSSTASRPPMLDETSRDETRQDVARDPGNGVPARIGDVIRKLPGGRFEAVEDVEPPGDAAS